MVFRRASKSSGPSNWTVSDLGSFYLNHRSELSAHANRILKNSLQAEEVLQDALLKFMLAAPELASEEHAKAYLHRTIENLCLDIFRMEGRRPNLVVLDEVASELEVKWQENKDHSDVIAAADDAAIVRQALAVLSPAERAALVMWEIEGRSTQEIARELGIKETAVRHTISRARTSLRRILSELIVDEKRGLTALDLLSNSYKRSSTIVKKSSKAALSLLLMFFAYLGFSNILDAPTIDSTVNSSVKTNSVTESNEKSATNTTTIAKQNTNEVKSTQVKEVNAKAVPLNFPGLDKNGIPIGFTVTDNSGSLGSLYFSGKEIVMTESGVLMPSIAKTTSGAANIFLNQMITQDSSGVSYEAMLSFGRKGTWVPLVSKVISTDIERQMSGNYLVTAVVQVKSEVETTIVIPALTEGRDLEVAPTRVITRILINATKTQVLAQAVQVIERVAK